MKKIWIILCVKPTKALVNIKEPQQHKQISTTNQVEDKTDVQFAQNVANHKEHELTASRHREDKIKLAMLRKQVSKLSLDELRVFHEKTMENQNCIKNAFTKLREIRYGFDDLMHDPMHTGASPREKRYQKEAFEYLKKIPIQERQAMIVPFPVKIVILGDLSNFERPFEFDQPPEGKFIIAAKPNIITIGFTKYP